MSLDDLWWYHSVEKPIGGLYKGIYEDDMILPYRRNLSKIDLRGVDAADVCTMEGMVPVLMCKGGASLVVASDSARPTNPPEVGEDTIENNVLKMAEIKRIHNVEFKYIVVPERKAVADEFFEQNTGQFDVVNFSGLLYHVYSPMHWLGAVRPLVRDGGLMIVSTNITFDDEHTMKFNSAGRLQPNLTTYWYISIGLFDYLLRYFRLRPLRCEHIKGGDGKGYVSVICRAEKDVIAEPGDNWMRDSAFASWDSKWFGGLQKCDSPETSNVKFKDGRKFESDIAIEKGWLDLAKYVRLKKPMTWRGHDKHTAVLRVGDTE